MLYCVDRAQYIFQHMNKAGVFASSQATAYWSYSALRTGVLATQVCAAAVNIYVKLHGMLPFKYARPVSAGCT